MPMQAAGTGLSLAAAVSSKAEPASRQSPISTDTDVKMDQNAPTKSDSATTSGGVVNNTQPLTVSFDWPCYSSSTSADPFAASDCSCMHTCVSADTII